MFFFIFGLGPHQEQTGHGEHRTCPRCNNHTRWARVRHKQRFTLFFIPIISWNAQELEQCTICGETLNV